MKCGKYFFWVRGGGGEEVGGRGSGSKVYAIQVPGRPLSDEQ